MTSLELSKNTCCSVCYYHGGSFKTEETLNRMLLVTCPICDFNWIDPLSGAPGGQMSICEDCNAELPGTGRTHCDACIMAMEANWNEATLSDLIAEFGKPLMHWHKCIGCGRRFDCQCENGDYSQPIECMECLRAEVEYYYDALPPLHRVTIKVRKPNIPEWNKEAK